MALQSLLPPARLSGWSPLTEGAAHLPSPPPGGSCLSPPPALQGSPAAGGSPGAGNTPSEFHSGNYPAAKHQVLWRRIRPRLEAPRGLLWPKLPSRAPTATSQISSSPLLLEDGSCGGSQTLHRGSSCPTGPPRDPHGTEAPPATASPPACAGRGSSLVTRGLEVSCGEIATGQRAGGSGQAATNPSGTGLRGAGP